MNLESKGAPHAGAEASAAWGQLDEPLRLTLERSFADRETGQPAAGLGLGGAQGPKLVRRP